jgi:maltose O-acetyltransferase
LRTQRERMVAGEPYDPADPELVALRTRARELCLIVNSGTTYDEHVKRAIAELIPNAATPPWIEPPFYCDYGGNIRLGKEVFFNFGCVVLDIAPIEIGDRTLFAPKVQIYSATHPLDRAQRAAGIEWGRPVRIGADVWVGGGTIINPGVTIGDGAVIGSGSVVVKDVPAGVLAVGNPCRVIREI